MDALWRTQPKPIDSKTENAQWIKVEEIDAKICGTNNEIPSSNYQEAEGAVIVVTHDERMIAGFDHVYLLKDGRIVGGRANTQQRHIMG